MKKVVFALLPGVLFFAASINAETALFTWVSGNNTINNPGVYGTKGVADAANIPGARNSSISWTDTSGNLWLFGGTGYDSIGTYGWLNDLWKYDISTGLWTWVSGNRTRNSRGVYGTKGLSDPNNMPGARDGSLSWTDANSDLWLFGGNGYDSTGTLGRLNDLWKYDISTGLWTWVSGDSTTNSRGVYGTKGMANAANIPGARSGSISWMDANGDLWLFGGYGYDSAGSSGWLNDLWKYEPSTGLWTWVSGDSTTNSRGIYGTKGVPDVANIPGARSLSISWTDADDNLWLFGGSGYDSTGSRSLLNDLWKYEPSTGQWTWLSGDSTTNSPGVYGTKGLADTENIPGARYLSISWTDADDNLWLFGGQGYDSAGYQGRLNDLWQYDISTGRWTWISGSRTIECRGIYGTKGTAAATNLPGARYLSISWMDTSGNLWLFGGTGYDSIGTYGWLNDLWKIEIVQDTQLPVWMGGNNIINRPGVYGTKGVADAANIPGARNSSISWTDADDNLWLSGGYGHNNTSSWGYLNDLWKCNTSTWEWMWVSGNSTINSIGVYGIKGVANAANIPGARCASISWADGAGDLWLFGGSGRDSAGSNGDLNDLWKYDISSGLWTWVSGSSVINSIGVYGTKGLPASANIPGARASSISWIDANGALWLFGGDGYDSAGSSGWLNDLWKYDASTGEWTWVSGPSTADNVGVYGTKGIADAANIPGVRVGSISWTDSNGALWLLGGEGRDSAGNWGYLNDLWKYDISSGFWTWVSGSSVINSIGVYGTKGKADGANVPGAREDSISWMDASGDLWLFGGNGYDSAGSSGYLNDLWKYDISTGQWTWILGRSTIDGSGVYGTKGVADAANIPGARPSSISWKDGAGDLWLFGGYGYDSAGSVGQLNDLWKIELIAEVVDFDEFALLAAHWMKTGCTEGTDCARADWHMDGRIDILDLHQLASSWLEKEMIYAGPPSAVGDFDAFALLAAHWLKTGCTEGTDCAWADWHMDGSIDLLDLQELAARWLEEE